MNNVLPFDDILCMADRRSLNSVLGENNLFLNTTSESATFMGVLLLATLKMCVPIMPVPFKTKHSATPIVHAKKNSEIHRVTMSSLF